MKQHTEKHKSTLPTPRAIRRACSRELYRTVKRLNIFIPDDKLSAAEDLYYRKVIDNVFWIYEHRDNRKKQADWFVEEVAPEIAALWEVDAAAVARAFRDGYGG
ncbi:dehydrogenase [Paenibacillus thermotolerans]|uniref:dehydrogenase n=1 Tax=Paenibacillus thermotolerans TaxID=3027807 RepID=UPI0023688EE7|nr:MULTISPECIES: dehydrogenase [unclassified Paenibacillus]